MWFTVDADSLKKIMSIVKKGLYAKVDKLSGYSLVNISEYETLKNKVNILICPGAGPHNGVYRGKFLGTEVTNAQWIAIASGTFDDLYIGDYWIINGITWRIAAFNYWFGTGSPTNVCTINHVNIVPDTVLDVQKMNDENSMAGGYVNSTLRTTYIGGGTTAIINDSFGAAHILTHKNYFISAVSSGIPSSGAFYNSTIDIMNERMVCGSSVFGFNNSGGTLAQMTIIDKSQLPLFALNPSLIPVDDAYFLYDVVGASKVAIVQKGGAMTWDTPNTLHGIRPIFGICAT